MQRPNPNQQFQLQQQQSQQKSMVMQQSSTSSSVQQQSSQQFMSQEFSQQQQFSSQQRISQHSVSRQVTQQRGQFHRKCAPNFGEIKKNFDYVTCKCVGVNWVWLAPLSRKTTQNHVQNGEQSDSRGWNQVTVTMCEEKNLKSAWKTLKKPTKIEKKNTKEQFTRTLEPSLRGAASLKIVPASRARKFCEWALFLNRTTFLLAAEGNSFGPIFYDPPPRVAPSTNCHRRKKKKKKQKERSQRPLRAPVGEGMSARASEWAARAGFGKCRENFGEFRENSAKFGSAWAKNFGGSPTHARERAGVVSREERGAFEWAGDELWDALFWFSVTHGSRRNVCAHRCCGATLGAWKCVCWWSIFKRIVLTALHLFSIIYS